MGDLPSEFISRLSDFGVHVDVDSTTSCPSDLGITKVRLWRGQSRQEYSCSGVIRCPSPTLAQPATTFQRCWRQRPCPHGRQMPSGARECSTSTPLETLGSSLATSSSTWRAAIASASKGGAPTRGQAICSVPLAPRSPSRSSLGPSYGTSSTRGGGSSRCVPRPGQ